MDITTNFDLGAGRAKPYREIVVTVGVRVRLKEIWSVPDIRQVIADSITPILRQMQMSERTLETEIERILLSGRLLNEVEYPYRYDPDRHEIVDEDGRCYPVSDYLEGRLPGSPTKKSGSAGNSSERKRWWRR